MESLLKAAEEIDSMDRKPKKKRGKPEKNCPECNFVNHARSSNCKSCDYTFYVRKKDKQELLAENWRDLKQGDVIKCIAGHGTYYLSKQSGEKIRLGHKGTFEVVEIHYKNSRSCGIWGRKIRGRVKEYVREYIYMGESYYNEELCHHNESHKIKVIKKHENG
jgi:hypothetical protein